MRKHTKCKPPAGSVARTRDEEVNLTFRLVTKMFNCVYKNAPKSKYETLLVISTSDKG